MVSPPPDIGSRAQPPAAAPTRSNTPDTQAGAAGPGTSVAAVDQADIRPLSAAGALQILVAEVRSALIEALAADSGGVFNPGVAAVNPGGVSAFPVNAGETLDVPVAAARVIVDLALQSLPETFAPDSWGAALTRTDLALQAGVQRAIDAVSAWRDVQPTVVAAAQESANLALSLLADEPIYPWPPPEWVGMAPRLARLWRRRRTLKRRLSDPDYANPGDPAISYD
jgi:hypothetical protein